MAHRVHRQRVLELSLLNRTAVALKGVNMQFPSRTRASGSWLLPNTEFDYERVVGDGRGSSLIVACAMWMARTFPEAPIRVKTRGQDGLDVPIPVHPMSMLIERPNPYYSGVDLIMASIIDCGYTNGNAYWLKVRSALGQPVELWYLPAALVEPKWPENSHRDYIGWYEYKYDSSKPPLRIPPSEIVHFRNTIDPNNTRKGLSPIASLLREVFTDDEAANFSASLLRNLGVPGVIISPADPEAEASGDDVEEVKEAFMRRFGGDRRGEPLVMKTRTEVKVLSFSPQQLDLKSLRRLPEERVTAVLGTPAIVVGFGAGLEKSSFANFAEAREAAWDHSVAPMQRQWAAALDTQLLSEWGDAPSAIYTYFDTNNVRILREDRSRVSKWATEQFEGGIITRAEARIAVGRQPRQGDDVYRIPSNILEVPADEGAAGLADKMLGAGAPDPAQDAPNNAQE